MNALGLAAVRSHQPEALVFGKLEVRLINKLSNKLDLNLRCVFDCGETYATENIPT